MLKIAWRIKPFDELSAPELYSIMQLRNEVFVVEQDCVFQDADDRDQASYHLMGWQQETLVAYSRIVPPAVAFDREPSIGRVATLKIVRGQGYGKDLMKKSIEELRSRFGNVPYKIGAQLYLKKFYELFGFEQSGEPYLEDGIPHIHMIRPQQPS
jgi:ElaA protein